MRVVAAHVWLMAGAVLGLMLPTAAWADAAPPAPIVFPAESGASEESAFELEAEASTEAERGGVGADLARDRLKRILYRERWERARELYAIGDYQGAGANLMALVNEPIEAPFLYEVRYYLAESLFKIGAWPGARHHFEIVLTNDPNGRFAAASGSRLAELALMAGELEIAADYFAEIVRGGQARSRAAYLLGKAFAGLSPESAVKYFGEVQPGSRFHAESLYHLGALAAASPETYALAVTRFEEARAVIPEEFDTGPGGDPEAPQRAARLKELIALSLARLHAESARYPEALAEYASVPDDGKYLDAALLESAWVLLQQDELLPALQNVQILLRERPGSSLVLEAALLVGYLTIEQGQFNQAYGHFEDTRILLEQLQSQLTQYAEAVPDPVQFYKRLGDKSAANAITLPAQIGLWVGEGLEVQESSELLEAIDEVEGHIRDLYRQLDQIEVLAAGPRGGPSDPAGLENRIRLELSDTLYDIQTRILELRLRPFIRAATERELELLRTVRRVRSELETIRHLPSDVNQASASRQQLLGRIADYLLQIHPEIGLDTTKRSDSHQVAGVDDPLAADDFLRSARRHLAELSREVSLDDQWIDAALEYTVYLEDRLHGTVFRRLRVDERYGFHRRATVLFRQAAELQSSLRSLGTTLADIQEFLLLDTRARVQAERKVLSRHQDSAQTLARLGEYQRGTHARRQFEQVLGNVADTAIRADLGALDTGWRVKEIEEQKVRELLSEKQVRLARLQSYYNEVAQTNVEQDTYPGVENLKPEDLARATGSIDSPYGRELLVLGDEVVGLARALYNAQLQLEQLEAGSTSAILTPEEKANIGSKARTSEGRLLRIDTPPQPEGPGGADIRPEVRR